MKSMIGGGAPQQTGAMLLEALVAILIFAIGILAIIGMQASAISASAESKYRSDASLLANRLIGQMWTSDRTPSTLKTNFEGGIGGADGASYTAWLGSATTPADGTVRKVMQGVMNAPPAVTIDGATGQVTIVVTWKAPNEPSGASAHNYTLVAQIR